MSEKASEQALINISFPFSFENFGLHPSMASLFTLNSLTLHSSSPFRGDISKLRPNPSPFFNISLQVKHHQNKASFTVLNQAAATAAPPVSVSGPVTNVRFRLDNLGPQPGSRKRGKRKGRGISAGQGGSCGFGMRGQKSRSGPGVRKGFEGGQMPLYRRIPKLRGIAGGNFGSWNCKFIYLFIIIILCVCVSKLPCYGFCKLNVVGDDLMNLFCFNCIWT